MGVQITGGDECPRCNMFTVFAEDDGTRYCESCDPTHESPLPPVWTQTAGTLIGVGMLVAILAFIILLVLEQSGLFDGP